MTYAHCLTVRDPWHPHTSREIRPLTGAAPLRALAPKTDKPFILLRNGQAVLRADWDQPVERGDLVAVVMLPQGGGGGGGGSNPLKMVLQLALTVVFMPQLGVNAWLGNQIAFNTGLGLVASSALANAMVGLAGMALVNALVPPPKPPSTHQAASLAAASPTYNLQAQGNMARLDAAIPVQYGRLCAYPDFAAQPYVEYAGNEQYLYQLLCLGQGHYDIEAIRIEDTPLSSFAEIAYEVVAPGETVDLFPTNVITSGEVSGQEMLTATYLPASGGYVANAAGTSATTLGLDFVAPRGLYYANDDGTLSAMSITCVVEAQAIDDNGVATGSWTVLGTETFTDKTTTPQRMSRRYAVAAGRYQVRVKRTDTKQTDTRYGHEILWAGLRAYLPETRDFGAVTLLAMRMRASNNLSSQASRKINVICTRKIPVWNGSAWSAPTATSSIAWALADACRDTVYGAGLPDARIDLAGLMALDAVWSARGDEFNGRFDSALGFWEAITKIAQAGRAKPFLQGGVVRCSRDGAQTTPVALFSMRNITRGSLSVDYIMPTTDTADAVEVAYVDARFWAPRRVTATLSGGTSSRPAKIDLFGVTSRDQAWREGLYQAASNRYRRRIIKFATEMEGFIPSPGDLIAIQHDMPAWGQGGEVVAYDGVTTNYLLYSEQFDNAHWTKENSVAITPNAGTDPLGGNTASRAVFPTGFLPRFYQTISGLGGQTVTFSIWAKSYSGANQSIGLYLRQGAFGTTYAGGSQTVTGEWRRLRVTATLPAGVSVMALIYQSSAGSPTNDLLIWGAQLEVNSLNTSYIRTTSAAASGYVYTLSEKLTWKFGSAHYLGLRKRDGSVDGPYLVASTDNSTKVAFSSPLAITPYTGQTEERTHVVFGWADTWRQLAKVIAVRPRGLYAVEIEAINEDASVHTAETGQTAPAVQTSQLTTLYTSPQIADLTLRSSASDNSKALLTWTPAPGAVSYQIEMAAGYDPYDANLTWTRVADTSANNYAVTAVYGAQTLIRVRGVGLTAGPWVTMFYGGTADYMWVLNSALMWNATDTTLMWRY